MNYQVFHVKAATEIGLVPAIILEHIAFWCEKNEANGINIRDGKAWTYNSVKAWSVMFPYLTPKMVRNGLDALVSNGAVEKAALNENRYDRTMWYTVTDYGYSLLCMERGNAFAPEGEGPLPAEASAICPEGPTNTNNNTSNNTHIYPPINPPKGEQTKARKKVGDLTEEQQSLFDTFWSFYPKRVGKGAAIKAFKKLNPDTALVKAICSAVAKAARSEDWRKDNGQYIPMPSTYLNGRRWEDEGVSFSAQTETADGQEGPRDPGKQTPAYKSRLQEEAEEYARMTPRQRREKEARKLVDQGLSNHEARVRFGLEHPDFRPPAPQDVLSGKHVEYWEQQKKLNAQYEKQWLEQHPEWR